MTAPAERRLARRGGASPLRLGLLAAALTMIVDQGFKTWMLFGFRIEDREPVELAPFLDLRLAWNTGISYSLLRADGPLGRFALVALALVAVVLLAVWLTRAQRRLTGVALGLLIGGALGNAYDRFARGAVADFFHVHIGDFSPWGVFNVADVGIVTGVVLLLYEAVFDGRRITDAG